MLTTPMEIWRASFVFWTKAAEAQMEFAQAWLGAWTQWEREAEKAGTEAIEAAAKAPFAPGAIAAPRAKRPAKTAAKPAAKAQVKGVSLKPVPEAPKRPSTH